MVAMPVDLSPHVTPVVQVGMGELPEAVRAKLVRTVVDTHLHLADMFELAFEDGENNVISALGVAIGTAVEVYGGAPGSGDAPMLISGEVTAIEGEYEGTVMNTVIRGYEKTHRLQRASRTRTFLDMTDSDIAKKIAREAGFRPDKVQVEDSSAVHGHLSQVAQTDWEFLKFRAAEIGFEVGVAAGVFFFRPASSATPSGGSGLGGAVSGAAGGLTGSGPATLTFQDNLIMFHPRLSAGGLVSDVEVRVWDYHSADVVVGSAPVKTGTADLEADPADMGGGFMGLPIPVPKLPKIPFLPSFGADPSTTARLWVDRPAQSGPTTSAAVDEMAKGLAEHVASTFAEAEGLAYGDPKVQAGQPVKIEGVAEEFKGTWLITNARHTFVPEQGGYRVAFTVSGRQDRSLFGLASGGASAGQPARIQGSVIGVVTNNADPDTLGRVKLAFPWLAPYYESDWARVVQYGAGRKWGGLFVPEVGDEVLVAFEFGDVRRPYVVGGLINGKTEQELVAGAVKATGPFAQVVKRGIVSRLGNRIVFEDDEPAPDAPVPTASSITISDRDGKLKIVLDKATGELTILCDSSLPPAAISIEQKGQGGSINVKSAGDITLEATAPGAVTVKGGAGVTIDGRPGIVEIKGSMIKLN